MLSAASKSNNLRNVLQQHAAIRALHSTAAVSADALDMADTFSRRHGEWILSSMVKSLGLSVWTPLEIILNFLLSWRSIDSYFNYTFVLHLI